MAFLCNDICGYRYGLMYALVGRDGPAALVALPKMSARVPVRPDCRH